MDYIQLRSDIYLVPTQEMRESILTSQYGDWSAGEDQTVKQLQAYTGSIFGTEAAAYAPSATFTNQCALVTAGKPGEELIVRDGAHIIRHQNGSPGRLARLLTRTIQCPKGYITPEQLQKVLRKKKDSQAPQSSVLVVEFPTLQGVIPPLQVFHQTARIGIEAGLHVHIDGARVFNAIAELKIEPHQIMKYCSSLTICLSKGLLAPVGSILVGTKQFVTRFKKNQKMLGGQFRKPGVVAGAALISLKKMRFQLWKDNQIARKFSSKLNQLGWIEITNKIETNIIYLKIKDTRINPSDLSKYLQQNGVFCSLSNGISRLVIHHYIREQQIQKVISLLELYRNKIQAKIES